MQSISSAWQATSQLEVVSVVFGVAYIILAARENILCWPAAFIGTGTAIFLFWDGSLLMESALNVYYLLMAVIGWWQWTRGGENQSKLEIQSWNLKQHLITFSLIAILTIISGSLLSKNTTAALPYLDSFTTWAAVITTWMVARKVLENWLYWIIINSASILLYIEREFVLYALLYAIYIVIAVIGYVQWKRKLNHAS